MSGLKRSFLPAAVSFLASALLLLLYEERTACLLALYIAHAKGEGGGGAARKVAGFFLP